MPMQRIAMLLFHTRAQYGKLLRSKRFFKFEEPGTFSFISRSRSLADIRLVDGMLQFVGDIITRSL